MLTALESSTESLAPLKRKLSTFGPEKSKSGASGLHLKIPSSMMGLM